MYYFVTCDLNKKDYMESLDTLRAKRQKNKQSNISSISFGYRWTITVLKIGQDYVSLTK